MKIYKMSNVKRFNDYILALEGNIWFLDRNDRRHDMKALVRHMKETGLEDVFGFPEGIDIVAEKQQDMLALLQYLRMIRYILGMVTPVHLVKNGIIPGFDSE